eukprot:TRINITY_DN3811_c0_g6_i1.p1 TRINITY_DN3811_c0_g6~~TRINITY_DN3811_c0_g6_i1.p1  ORF type:complete len:360 (-),score=27.59 TRINITY_DN3811_c0_g6_i1:83-1162(-)
MIGRLPALFAISMGACTVMLLFCGLSSLVVSWASRPKVDLGLVDASPTTMPRKQDSDARGTLLVFTSFLSLDFEQRDKDIRRAISTVIESFPGVVRDQFRQDGSTAFEITDHVTNRKKSNYRSSASASKILLINECIRLGSSSDARRVNETLHDLLYEYGRDFNFEIVQKKTNCGQAASLNMVLNQLHDYKYWLHWEESWHVDESKFISDAWFSVYDFLDKHPEVGQLKFHKLGYDLHDHKTILSFGNIEFCVEAVPQAELQWSPFSLRPSLNLVVHALNAGYFDRDPEKRRVTFEQEWGNRWSFGADATWPLTSHTHKVHATVADVQPFFAVRNDNHTSSYLNKTFNFDMLREDVQRP